MFRFDQRLSERIKELDPDFALAYRALGSAHNSRREIALAAAAEKKCYDLRTRMTEPNRFLAETLYYDVVTGDWEKAYTILSEWVQTFPRDVLAHSNFARCVSLLGQPERAADEARESVRLLPTPVRYNVLIAFSIFADRLNEA